MSVAGGLHLAFGAATAAGCDCLQIFVKNQRQWSARPLADDQVQAFKNAQAVTRVAPVVAHASYLLNLASPDAVLRQRSVTALVDELQRCEALGLSGLVVHPGAHLESELNSGLRRIARSLNAACASTAGFAVEVLLETTAGQGSAIGWRFEHLQAILEQVRDPARIGVCLDTCHLFAAGYDFRTADAYAAMIGELDRTVGAARVRCIHVNDSQRELASRVDRHAHVGKGRIGKAGFAHFINDPRWRGAPFILETPKGKDGRGADLDRINLKRLRALLAKPVRAGGDRPLRSLPGGAKPSIWP